MFDNGKVVIYKALTPLHPGTGSSLSYVDLPIQRERHTNFPMMAGSGIKGVIRDVACRVWNDDKKVDEVFGSDSSGEDLKASIVSFTDAKILFYPVRSLRGIFALITCPYVLERFARDIAEILKTDPAKGENPIKPDTFKSIEEGKVVIIDNKSVLKEDKEIGLEEFLLNFEAIELAEIFKKFNINFFNEELSKRIAIVSDSVFADLVNYAVEVRTRIKIDQKTGTAQGGALFVEEFVPAEAIFYSQIFINSRAGKNGDVVSDLQSLLDNKTMQFGADETIGSGFVRLEVYPKNN
ncbi:MAG TPA: type III-B CRISPR module RAMP protein Cmr4 [Spirochaetota bacterium]|jgi:CRISPR-associated protein Cmr4|nr:type III-B CRISPR module RAMP protein Cmr4 [Spirochaetota bacterium]HRS63071.1 type III-B CRISPR module RAMP protein Cmr4 [Spirochaetota bacterium]HRU66562.1 type III-B CRISPR module RAMP protein Cmr4 [Spirochaetota bacterium]